jgi:anti-anti-sigma factor
MTLVDRNSTAFAPFQLRGEVDVATAAEVLDALTAYAATSEGDIVCDCTELELLDSSGIAGLVAMQHTLEGLGRTLRLVNVNGSPRQALEILSLLDLFDIR